MMPLISEPLEMKLREQEADPTHPLEARAALEEAVIFQLRRLASGLIGYLAAQGHDSTDAWLQHSRANSDCSEPDLDHSQAISVAKKQFAEDLSEGRIRIINPVNLGKFSIRVLNGSAALWNEQKINRQFRQLGSRLRLINFGSSRFIVNELRKLLGHRDFLPVDGRFILGEVAALSTWQLGPIFDYERELAVSPFVEIRAVGLNFENRIVVRRPLLRSLYENEEIAQYYAMSTLAHEMHHVTGFRPPPSWGSYLRASWLEDTEADLLRFAEFNKSRDELASVFSFNFENPVIAHINNLLGKEHFPSLPLTLDAILKNLIKRNHIAIDSDRKMSCQKFKDGRRWLV